MIYAWTQVREDRASDKVMNIDGEEFKNKCTASFGGDEKP